MFSLIRTFPLTLSCLSSLFFQFDLLNGWSHIHLILPPFLPNITLGIESMPTYSSVSAEYFLDSTAPTFVNLVISRPLWTLQNLDDLCPGDPKPFTPCPLMISTNFPLHGSSHFLSTSQFCRHKTGLEEYTQLLHQLVSTRTHGNSDMQIN